ncbi:MULTISPECIES: NADPH-dependent FMN reductase [unclassified Amycolatopsis]|uniref:NADPH-dependent FMN reductase n=1 Tax=unclassified Amycolatopsis TaxID=2618356 RepID=UPI00210346A7|nr:NAD(P)H-dependent oxidoreductase [Amycolatopsis sp. DSM 110486]
MDGENPLRLAVVIGSVREGRFGPTAANWFLEQVAPRTDLDVDVLDLADACLPDRLGTSPVPSEVAAVGPRLEAADAFVIVTPEYNHSFPASLKTLIDWHHDEWQRKPVAFVSYGGFCGGLRAVEALRLVFAGLHAATLRDVVSFHGIPASFDAAGRPVDAAAKAAAAKTLLDELTWWARALRDARAARALG